MLAEPLFWLGEADGLDPGVPAGAEPMPTVPEFPGPLMASNTDIPCGPIVMSTGLPSLDLACTTNDRATTFTSVKPAFCRSWRIFRRPASLM